MAIAHAYGKKKIISKLFLLTNNHFQYLKAYMPKFIFVILEVPAHVYRAEFRHEFNADIFSKPRSREKG